MRKIGNLDPVWQISKMAAFLFLCKTTNPWGQPRVERCSSPFKIIYFAGDICQFRVETDLVRRMRVERIKVAVGNSERCMFPMQISDLKFILGCGFCANRRNYSKSQK